jgi:hypothetical protein
VRWHKLGPIPLPPTRPAFMVSHAAVPFAVVETDHRVRVWFSTRDAHNRSQTAWALIDLREPHRVLELSAEPVLAPGALGAFDDSGAMLSWIVRHDRRWLMYYVGWNLGVTVPFRNALGLAVSDDGLRFCRAFRGPIVDRSATEPHFVTAGCVLVEGARWRMWYVGCVEWIVHEGRPRHRYHIKYAESADGVHWDRSGAVAIDFKDASEYAISRPSVIRDPDRYRMWYSTRGTAYRIGYAESPDGATWTRRDDLAGIDVSPHGWDSEMIAYPHVFDHGGRRYMLYNGNGYGRTGFGLAVAS